MKISVLIPAYNCSATIGATIESVLLQTIRPYEILVMDDGSSDDTVSVLETYRNHITLYRQPNQGPACSRNRLVASAKGDLLAFLDSDDLWHPSYLEVQERNYREHPEAIAFWTGHRCFQNAEVFKWDRVPFMNGKQPQVLSGIEFFRKYNQATGPFSSMSFSCVPRNSVLILGNEPFKGRGVEDSYFYSLMALLGPVIFDSNELVAYRLRKESLSQDRLSVFSEWIEVFKMLQTHYNKVTIPFFKDEFRSAFASKRRSYAKLLLRADRKSEARSQLYHSLANSFGPISLAKSLSLIIISFLPRGIQPKWPSTQRKIRELN